MAEVFVAFIALSTIVVVLQQAVAGSLSSRELFGVRILIEEGCFGLISCILPVIIGFFAVSPEVVWRISSGYLGFAIVAVVVDYIRRRQRVWLDETARNRFIYLTLGFAGIVACIQVYNAAGPGQLALYALGVGWILLDAVVSFAYMLGLHLEGTPGS